MKRHIIGNGINLLKIVVEGDSRLELCVFGKERVIADNLHTKVNRSLCNESADCAETDNSKGFALDFGTCECALALFNGFAHVVALVLDGLAPVDSLCYLTA